MFVVVRIAIQSCKARLSNSEERFFLSCAIIVIRMRSYGDDQSYAETRPVEGGKEDGLVGAERVRSI
jgi:hypothetical protein